MSLTRAYSELWKGPWRFLRRAAEDRRGVSAIEFALILPVMIIMYVAAVELGNMLTINRRADAVASTAADLVAQEKTTSNAALRDVMDASKSILAPYSEQPLKIVLSSVVADDQNKTTIDWSCASTGATAHAKDASYNLPAGLTEADSSVIVAEVTYDFVPLVGLIDFWSPGSFQMSRTFYTRTRKSLTVKKDDQGCP